MGIAERLGRWLDHFFALKQTEADAEKAYHSLLAEFDQLQKNQVELSDRVKFLEAMAADKKSDETILKMRDELNGLKALLKMAGPRSGGNPGPDQKLDGSQPWKR